MNSKCNVKTFFRLLIFLSAMAAVSGAVTPRNIWAIDKAAAETASQSIRITADNLKVDTQSNQAVFSGHATAVQGSTRLSADQLTITYGNDGKDKKTTSGNIDMILAEGNVRIEMDEGIATATKAEYYAGERKLVLSGPDAKVINDQGEMNCGTIVYLRDQGTMECRMDGDKQVKAVIRATERGLN